MRQWATAGATEVAEHFKKPPPLPVYEASLVSSSEEQAEHKPELRAQSGYSSGEDGALDRQRFSRQQVDILTRRFFRARLAFAFFIISSVIFIGSGFLSLYFLDAALGGELTSNPSGLYYAKLVDGVSTLSAIILLISFIWSAFAVGQWTVQAISNLRESDCETTISPAWSVLWYFVPFASLWMPFKGIAQIWRGSVHKDPVGDSALPLSMRFWWAFWLIGNTLNTIAFNAVQTHVRGGSFEWLYLSHYFNIAGASVHIASAILLLRQMDTATSAQRSSWRPRW